MNLLITGYKGFIGQNAVELLKDRYNLTLFEWGENFPSLNNIDCVMHFGAISSTTETDVEKVMCHNYDFTIGLIDACAARGIPLQFSSSASVYGKNTEFKESSKVDPKTPYAWSKYMVEKYATRNNSHVQCFRYFNVYGKHEDHKGSQASPYHQFRKQAETLGEITVFEGSDNFKRDFVPVEKIIEVQESFLTKPVRGVWNVGTGEVKSFLEVAESFNVPIKTIPMPDNLKGSYQSYTCADITELNKVLAL
jgi:ADP-L-glycero-D-manno-heptose 6-epimerase